MRNNTKSLFVLSSVLTLLIMAGVVTYQLTQGSSVYQDASVLGESDTSPAEIKPTAKPTNIKTNTNCTNPIKTFTPTLRCQPGAGSLSPTPAAGFFKNAAFVCTDGFVGTTAKTNPESANVCASEAYLRQLAQKACLAHAACQNNNEANADKAPKGIPCTELTALKKAANCDITSTTKDTSYYLSQIVCSEVKRLEQKHCAVVSPAPTKKLVPSQKPERTEPTSVVRRPTVNPKSTKTLPPPRD